MRSSLSLSVDIASSPDEVYALVCDPMAHGAMHPLVQRVEIHSSTPEETRFSVRDRVQLFGVPLSITIEAVMRPQPAERSVTFTARVGPGVRIETRYVVSPRPGGARIDERAEVQTVIPFLRRKMLRDAGAAHQALLLAFKARLEGAA